MNTEHLALQFHDVNTKDFQNYHLSIDFFPLRYSIIFFDFYQDEVKKINLLETKLSPSTKVLID